MGWLRQEEKLVVSYEYNSPSDWKLRSITLNYDENGPHAHYSIFTMAGDTYGVVTTKDLSPKEEIADRSTLKRVRK